MNYWNFLWVGMGGFLGSVFRYATVKTIDATLQVFFPYGTLTVNVVGSFALGLLYPLVIKTGGLSESWRLFLGVGFCGGFTTFSAFAFENFILLEQKQSPAMFLYALGSIFLGIISVFLGIWAGRQF